MRRRIAILLYVVGGDRYRAYLKKGRLKYLPNFLIPKIKSTNLGDIVKEGRAIGKVMGISTYPIGDLNESKLEKLVSNILEEIGPDYHKIYFEDFKGLKKEQEDYILESTGLSLTPGRDIRVFNVAYIISEIYDTLGKAVNSSDTLIISKDRDTHLELILLLMNKISFFTCLGLHSSIRDDIYDEIFKTTGVSIFQPIHIDKLIKNYGIIINFAEELEFDLGKIRNQALIIDFSKNKPFKILESSKKNVILIEDIRLEINGLNSWIDGYVSPELFEALGEEKSIFSHIYANYGFYRLNDFINKLTKKSGRI